MAISGEKGEGNGNLGQDNQDLKIMGWEEYQVVGNFVTLYTPGLRFVQCPQLIV